MVNQPVTAFRKAWQLSGNVYRYAPAGLRRKNRIRFSLVSLLHSTDALEWFCRLESTDWMQPLVSSMPTIFFKPMRAYLSTRWPVSRRKKVIADTCELLRKHPVFLNALLDDEGRVLASYADGRYGALDILLCNCRHSTSKEGELAVKLRNPVTGKEIIKMVFSFEELDSGAYACYIGCIQGCELEQLDDFRAVTRAMHGLRPASLMVFVARALINALDVRVVALYGLGDSIHPFRKKHLVHLPFVHRIKFSYDRLWMEAGGSRQADGWFRLPVEPARREATEIKSRKKAMYQRRYQMLDDLSLQIRQSIRGERRSGPDRPPFTPEPRTTPERTA